MNKEFEIDNNEVVVYDEYGYQTTRELTYNIKKILICENNIEEMKDMIENEKISISDSKRKIKSEFLYTITTGLWFISFILNSFTGRGLIAVMNLLCTLMHGSRVLFTYLRESKNIKICDKNIDNLKEELEKENVKLKKLKKDNHNNFNSLPIKSSYETLSTSDQIIDLKHKLEIIRYYINHKRQCIRCYKKGTLNDELSWHGDSVKLIEELIKQDYPDLEVSENLENKKEREKSLIKSKM